MIVLDIEQAEGDLRAGALSCPRCSAALRPLCALAAAVLAWRHRFVEDIQAWTLIGVFTAGRLLAPP